MQATRFIPTLALMLLTGSHGSDLAAQVNRQQPRQVGTPAKAPGGSPSRVTHVITIHRNSQAPSTDIQLRDIAQVQPTGMTADRLLDTVLAPTPKSRLPRELSLGQIQQTLAAQGFDLGTLKFQGSQRTVVQPLFRRLPGKDVQHAAEVVLKAVLKAEQGNQPKVEYRLRTNLQAVDVPPGRTGMQTFARVKGGATQPTQAVVEVLFRVDGKDWRTIPLQYQLTRYQYVLKATGPIRTDTPLGEHNVIRAIEPVRGAVGLFAQDFTDIRGMVAKRNLRAGMSLSMTADITPPAVIRAGSPVTLVVINGKVRITANVRANSNAAVGESVQLINPNSGRILSAIAEGPGLAVLDVTRPSATPASRTRTPAAPVPAVGRRNPR